jgi:hypothetical protein
VTLIAGRPKAGKTTLLFALLRAILRGEEFVGQRTKPASILLLSEERSSTLRSKLDCWRLDDRVHLLMRHDAARTPFAEIVGGAVQYCHANGITVLVIDTWDKFTGLTGDKENSAGEVIAAVQPLLQAAASGLAVVIIAHQRKADGDFGEAMRGSNALVGSVDIVRA